MIKIFENSINKFTVLTKKQGRSKKFFEGGVLFFFLHERPNREVF